MWTLLEPRAHHVLCSLLIPNLRQLRVTYVCVNDCTGAAERNKKRQRNLAQRFLTEEFWVTELERSPHFSGHHDGLTIDTRMCVTFTTRTDDMFTLQTLGFVRLYKEVMVRMWVMSGEAKPRRWRD